MQWPQKKEAKKLRHLGSLRAHFHLPPMPPPLLSRPTLTEDTPDHIYTTTSDQLEPPAWDIPHHATPRPQLRCRLCHDGWTHYMVLKKNVSLCTLKRIFRKPCLLVASTIICHSCPTMFLLRPLHSVSHVWSFGSSLLGLVGGIVGSYTSQSTICSFSKNFPFVGALVFTLGFSSICYYQ